jgi:hypothetical protein
MVADLERKLKHGDLSESTADAFRDLYAFAREVGDRVTVGGAKHANFQLKIDAHQGDTRGDASVFTANVSGKLKIWPAGAPIEYGSDPDPVEWDRAAYTRYQTDFHALRGVGPGDSEVQFDAFVRGGDVEAFKTGVEAFVSACRP